MAIKALGFGIFDSERLIHAVKTAIACLLGYGITKAAHFPVDQWIVITIIVVMCAQINVGSMLHKSYMRLVGTSAGSALAAITLELFGSNQIAIAVMLGLSTMVFSYTATSDADYSDAGTLGAVTIAIILISKNPTIVTAANRFFEISLGILIAALVSQFILPIHARSHLRRLQAKTIDKLRYFYIATLMAEPTEQVTTNNRELDEEIVKSLSTQRSLAKQSAHEPLGKAFDLAHFNNLLRCEKEIFRSIICMNYAYSMLGEHRKALSCLPEILQFHHDICSTFEKISPYIKKQTLSKSKINIPSLLPVKHAVNIASQHTTSDEMIYIDGFLFCASLLVIHLTELALLVSSDETSSIRSDFLA